MPVFEAVRRLSTLLATVLALTALAHAQTRPWLEIPLDERPVASSKESAQEVLRLVREALKAVEARGEESATKVPLIEALKREEQLLLEIVQLHNGEATEGSEAKAELDKRLAALREEETQAKLDLAEVEAAKFTGRATEVPEKELEAARNERDAAAAAKAKEEDDKGRAEQSLKALEDRIAALPALLGDSRTALAAAEEALAQELAAGTDSAQIDVLREQVQALRFEVEKRLREQVVLPQRISSGVPQIKAEIEKRELSIAEARARGAAKKLAQLEERDAAYKRDKELSKRATTRELNKKALEDPELNPAYRPYYEANLRLVDLNEEIARINEGGETWRRRFSETGDLTILEEEVRELSARIEAETAGFDDLPNDPAALSELAEQIRLRLESLQAALDELLSFRKPLSEAVQRAKAESAELPKRFADWNAVLEEARKKTPDQTEVSLQSWTALRDQVEVATATKLDLLIEARHNLPTRSDLLRRTADQAEKNLAWIDSRMLWSRSSTEISAESLNQVLRDAGELLPALERGAIKLMGEIVAPSERSILRRMFGGFMLLCIVVFGVYAFRRFPKRLERFHDGASQSRSLLIRCAATLFRRTLLSCLFAVLALAAAQVLDLSWSISGPILIVLIALFAWRLARALIDLLFDPTSPERIIPGDPALLGTIHRALRMVLLISVVFIPISLLMSHAGYDEVNPGFVELWNLVHGLLVALVLLVSLFRPAAMRSLFAGSKGALALSFEQLFLLGYPIVASAVLFLVVLNSLRYTIAAQVFSDWLVRTIAASAVCFLAYRWLLRTLRPENEPYRSITPDQFDDEKEYLGTGSKLFFDRLTRMSLRLTMAFALIIYAVQSWPLAQTAFFSDTDSGRTIKTVLLSIGAIFITMLLLRTYRDGMRFVILPRTGLDRGVQYAILTLSSYVLMTIGLIVVFNLLDVNGEQIAWVVSALAVGIGFGLQSIVRNLVSGIILLIERPVKVGDRVIVGDRSGIVDRITIRSTTVMTYSNVGIVIPNEELISGQVINQSLGTPKLRSDMRFGVAYGSDLGSVRKIAVEVCDKHGLVLRRPAPELFFIDFGESSLDFELRYWTAEDAHVTRVASDLRMALDAAFRRNKVEVPFPQRDLHLRSVDTDILEELHAAGIAHAKQKSEEEAAAAEPTPSTVEAAKAAPKEKAEAAVPNKPKLPG